MGVFLGADCGQTHSRAVLMDENGCILGVGRSGPCNHFDPLEGEVGFCQAVQEVVDNTLLNSGREIADHITAACFGFSDPWAHAESAVRACVLTCELSIVEDVVAAHTGALAGEAGIVILAGTGSVAYGITEQGESACSGGWGYLLSDEGAGYHIGIQALRAAARARDGRGEATMLFTALLEHFQFPGLTELNEALLSGEIKRVQIAQLAELVSRSAQQGDQVARQILSRAGVDLSACVTAVARRLAWQDPPVSTVGGVFKAGELLFEPFWRGVQAALPAARYIPPRFPPVVGAVLISLQRAGRQVSPLLLQNLEQSLPMFPEY